MGKRLNWFRLIVVAIAVFSVVVFTGCDSPLDPDTGTGDGTTHSAEDDGTVTFSLNNAGDAPVGSSFAVFVFESGSDPNTVDGLVAVNYSEITDDSVSDLVLKEPENDWEPSGDDWIATGGRAYDLYAYTTDDVDLDYNTTSKVTLEYPDTFSVDGDFTQEFDYEADLVDAPTLTVEVTGANAPEVTNNDVGETTYFVALVMLDGEWISLIDVEFTDDSFSTLMENGIGSTWLYETGTEYEVVFILSPNSINEGPFTEGSYTLWTEMTFDQSDGHSTVTKDFGTLPSSSENIIIDEENMTFAPSDQNTWYGPFNEAVSDYEISGTVTDGDDRGIEGIQISFSGTYESAETDANGGWSKSGLTGEVTVTPLHDDWTFNPESRDVDCSNDSVDFTATAVPDPEFTGTGRVTSNGDNGLADVEMQFSGGFDSVTTSPTGYWTKFGLSNTVTVTPFKEGWVFDPESQVVSEGSTTADFSASATISDGAGTPEDPYLIATAEDLYEVRYHLDSYYRQTADIDLGGYSAGSGWLPIGSGSSRFTGSYDGDGKRITGLTINRPETNEVGLFGYVGPEGEVHALELVDVDVTGQMNVGGLAGVNSGLVFSCHVSGQVHSTNSRNGGLVGYNNPVTGPDSGRITGSSAAVYVTGESWGMVGGLVGYNSGSIEDSWATGNVTGGSEQQGGLVGLNCSGASVSDSWATGTVTGSGAGGNVGGLIGANRGGSVTDSYAEGSVTGAGSRVGGLVGQNDNSSSNNGEIRNSHATGNVNGEDNSVGGLVGANYALVSECFATGFVTGQGNDTGGLVGANIDGGDIQSSYAEGAVSGEGRVGGLAGDISSSGAISNSFAIGSVEGDWRVGGLVGNAFTEGLIQHSYSIGVVTGNTSVGGLLGWGSQDNCAACYWDTEASEIEESAGGGGCTTAQMQAGTPGTYINPDGSNDDTNNEENLMYDGWNSAVWDFGTATDYAVLRWQ